MAISLEQINRKPRKQNAEKRNSVSRSRPWHSPKSYQPPLAKDPGMDFSELATRKVLPDFLESQDSSELLLSLAQEWGKESWHKLQKKSYWLSRLTHQNSWLKRFQIQPKLKIPLPSWFTRKTDHKDFF